MSYYNPQMDQWTPDLVNAENDAKDRALVLLFVISNQTRGVASMVEVAELVGCGRDVVLVIQDIPEQAMFNDTEVSVHELRDLNRGRSYLADVAWRHGCPVFQSIEAAVDEVLGRFGCTRGSSTTPSPLVSPAKL